MKAITTKYIGPSNAKGSRIRASDMDGNRITIPKPGDLTDFGGHKLAAEALCDKMDWKINGRLEGGAVKGGYVFIVVS